MNSISRLNSALEDWRIANDVSLEWKGDTLRLVDESGTNRTVVCFPTAFWNAFANSSADRQDSAIDSIRLAVELGYDARWMGAYAKEIAVPMSYVEEF